MIGPFPTRRSTDTAEGGEEMKSNCEECGTPIESEYALCVSCEQRLYGTVDGQQVNEPEPEVRRPQ